jgi:hypothetical protein
MKPAQLGTLNADLAPIEEDLATRIGTIFERCPQLFGFTVQDSSSLPEELRSIALERELVVSDIGVYPVPERRPVRADLQRDRGRAARLHVRASGGERSAARADLRPHPALNQVSETQASS